MRIAVASGKGGTGKTTVATSLVLSLASDAGGCGPSPLLLDCDAEAPNAHLFLKPDLTRRKDVCVMIPRVEEDCCTGCGRCSEVCQYHAIAVIGTKVLVFPQLCHGCGSCTRQCPEAALTEVPSRIGVLEAGQAHGGTHFARGVLNVGEPMAVPVIRELRKWAAPQPHQVVVVDASPGTSCPMVEAVRGADFLLLVTEPTPFGLHDLKLASAVARQLGLAAGVIVNRDNHGGYPPLEAFCASEGLPILLRIPFERAIAEGLARGDPLVTIDPQYILRFREVFSTLAKDLAAQPQRPSPPVSARGSSP